MIKNPLKFTNIIQARSVQENEHLLIVLQIYIDIYQVLITCLFKTLPTVYFLIYILGRTHQCFPGMWILVKKFPLSHFKFILNKGVSL